MGESVLPHFRHRGWRLSWNLILSDLGRHAVNTNPLPDLVDGFIAIMILQNCGLVALASLQTLVLFSSTPEMQLRSQHAYAVILWTKASSAVAS